MKLTQKQWNWLVAAPKRVECHNGQFYEFSQSWDTDGNPVVEMHRSSHTDGYLDLREISPHKPLDWSLRYELRYVWNQWKKQQSNVIHLTTDDILDRYKHLSIDEVIFSHTNISIQAAVKADKIILHHNGKTKILKSRYEW